MINSDESFLIAVPCYNCVSQSKRVFEALDKLDLPSCFNILFIDNISSDGTAESLKLLILSSLSNNKFDLIQNEENYGLGGSQKVAFDFAVKGGYDGLFVLHGDDQACTKDIVSMYHEFRLNQQTVLGSRFMIGSTRLNYRKSRVIGNKILNVIFSILCFRKIEDLGSGLNLFNVNDFSLDRVSNYSNSFNFNVDLILDLLKYRKNFRFHPIKWRETDQVSNAGNFRVAFSMLKSLVLWRFGVTKKNLYESRSSNRLI